MLELGLGTQLEDKTFKATLTGGRERLLFMKKITVDDKDRLERHAEGLAKRKLRKRSYRTAPVNRLRVFSRVRRFAPHTLNLFDKES